MKRRTILVLGLVLLLGAVLSSGTEATPAAGDATWPLTYITRPCVSIGIQDPIGGPPRIVCSGITGRAATITVPTPWLSDRAPELSLVSIPTYFNLEWDPASAGAQDSQPLTIANPVGNPTDKLLNVRVQIRLRALGATGSESSYHLLTENVAVSGHSTLVLLRVSSDGKVTGDYAKAACLASTAPGANALLTVSEEYGGYALSEGGGSCRVIQEHLGGLSGEYPFNLTSPLFQDEESYYMDWQPLSMSQFLTFTPYASIYGAGTDHGSPAEQITVTTRFIMDARVVWDLHQHKDTKTVTDCQWSYWDDYDFIDWDRWPRPIYCRTNVTVSWPTYCDPWATEGSLRCPYGHPDDWWISYGPIEVQAIRRPDGSYGTTYDFVSVQSQALLTAP